MVNRSEEKRVRSRSVPHRRTRGRQAPAELKPLAAEYHELEQIAQRLGLSLDDDATPAGKRRPASPKARRRARASTTKTRAAVSTRDTRGEAATAKASVAPRLARSPRSTSRNGRASSSRTSRRQQDVLRLVHQRPGITVREIAKDLGVDATGLYRPVHKLEQDGAIIKRGVSLQPTSG